MDMTNASMGEMRRIVYTLNAATEQYDAGNPQMSDIKWDSLYFRLKQMEHALERVLPESPTRKIHYKAVNSLEKVRHNHLMLSLDKTKDSKEIKTFLGDKDYICMGKMDGLTLSLFYKNGNLVSAETRGDGIEGEQVLHNAITIWNIPKSIKGAPQELIVDGEIICTYQDFEKFQGNYKNPRNFASGSIRLLDANECRKRKLTFIAWDVIKGFETLPTLSAKLQTLSTLGFSVVPFVVDDNVYKKPIEIIAEDVFDLCRKKEYPIDGLVFKFNDCDYYAAQGRTDHHFKGGIAFKRYDEEIETTLRDIEWQLGRSGVLTPVAIFDEVELGGTMVSRASLHNISVMDSLYPNTWSEGLKVTVFKANEIIPQLSDAYVKGYMPPANKKLFPPRICPYCGQPTTLKDNNGVKTLYCLNADCGDKIIAQIEHFCSKKGMDIKGLSTATLQKLYKANWINNIEDIFNLSTHREEWIAMPGFGEKLVDKILAAIDESRKCTLETFITALGIPLIGRTVAKEIVKEFPTYNEFRAAINDRFDF
ncbi:MAG: NAD-dependent DNA ligase LigA, partial [Clostridia bacterium]|nr:NAD-dependent DNA ligase LigA [Clostridia bacterium]